MISLYKALGTKESFWTKKKLEFFVFFFLKLALQQLPCAPSIPRTHSTFSQARETVRANRDFGFHTSCLFNLPSLWPLSLFSSAEKTGGGCCSWLVKQRVQLLVSSSSSEWFPLRTFYIYTHMHLYLYRRSLFQYLIGARRKSCCKKARSRKTCHVFICFCVSSGLELG